MELIKQIRSAEAKAKEIIAMAKQDSVKLIEDAHAQQQESYVTAKQQRNEAIAAAKADAEKQGVAEVEALRAEGDAERDKMLSASKAKMGAAVDKIVGQIKNLD